MKAIKSVLSLFAATDPRKYASTAAGLIPRQRATFIKYVTKDAPPAKTASFIKLVIKRVAKIEAKRQVIMDETSINQTQEGRNSDMLKQARIQARTAEGADQVALAIRSWNLAVEMGGDEMDTSVAFKWASQSAWMIVIYALDKARKTRLDPDSGTLSLAMRREERRIEVVMDGCAIVFGYLIHSKMFDPDRIQMSIDRNIIKELSVKEYKETEYSPTNFTRLLKRETRTAERAAKKQGITLTDHDLAVLEDKLIAKELRRHERDEIKESCKIDRHNELVGSVGESISKEVTSLFLAAKQSKIVDLAVMPAAIALAMAKATRKAIDTESPDYPQYEGRMQHLNTISMDKTDKYSAFHKDRAEDEREGWQIFLENDLDPLISTIIRKTDELKRANALEHDPILAKDNDRRFGSGEQKEYDHGGLGLVDGGLGHGPDADDLED